jgi:hypothetical protein
MDPTRPPAARGGGPAWVPPPAGLRPMLAVPVTQLPAEAGWAFEPPSDMLTAPRWARESARFAVTESALPRWLIPSSKPAWRPGTGRIPGAGGPVLQ